MTEVETSAEVFVKATTEALEDGVTFEELWNALTLTVAFHKGHSPRQQALTAARTLRFADVAWLRQCLVIDTRWPGTQDTPEQA